MLFLSLQHIVLKPYHVMLLVYFLMFLSCQHIM
uniref:Uncharacterized protein n=1 Tax=Arundo donax TaxID=35708 RepID=A0A0A9GN16_ARUDO